MTTLLPGFEIREKLYESSRSLVLRARDPENDRSVIIKLLRNEHPGKEEIARYRHEYEMLTKMAPLESVVNVYELQEHTNSVFMVLEDTGGISLRRHMEGKAFPVARFLPLAVRMAECLYEIHSSGFLHGDVKPSNFLYDPRTGRVTMIDLDNAAPFTREGASVVLLEHLTGTLPIFRRSRPGG